MESGDKIMEAMEGASSLSTTSAGNLPQASEVQKNCFNQLLRSYDSEMGGFSKAPKFPQPVNFNFLFHYYSLKPKDDRAKQGLKMALHTLDMMAKGGIHDHVSQVSSNSFPDFRIIIAATAILMQFLSCAATTIGKRTIKKIRDECILLHQ